MCVRCKEIYEKYKDYHLCAGSGGSQSETESGEVEDISMQGSLGGLVAAAQAEIGTGNWILDNRQPCTE